MPSGRGAPRPRRIAHDVALQLDATPIQRLDRLDEGGDAALHVGGAASPEPTVAFLTAVRVDRPLVQRTGTDRVDVTIEGERTPAARSAADPDDVRPPAVSSHELDLEPEPLELTREQPGACALTAECALGVVGEARIGTRDPDQLRGESTISGAMCIEGAEQGGVDTGCDAGAALLDRIPLRSRVVLVDDTLHVRRRLRSSRPPALTLPCESLVRTFANSSSIWE